MYIFSVRESNLHKNRRINKMNKFKHLQIIIKADQEPIKRVKWQEIV